jgi:hypothetical protein
MATGINLLLDSTSEKEGNNETSPTSLAIDLPFPVPRLVNIWVKHSNRKVSNGSINPSTCHS